MATHAYPEGKDPGEVYADYIAANTTAKEGDLREAAGDDGEVRPPNGLPEADPAPVRPVGPIHQEPQWVRTEQARLHAETMRRNLDNAQGVGDYVTQDELYQPNRQGVQYVVAPRPMTPILRPLRQTMYSRMTARPGTTRMMGFTSCAGQRDEAGINLTMSDTNMTQSGMLGTPLQYDLDKLGIHPFGAGADYKRQWDAFLNYQPDFTWLFGQNTPWVRTAINLMEMKFPFMTAREAMELRHQHNDFPQILRQIGMDMALPRTVSMVTPDRRARRIDSTECFRAEINFTRRAWGEPYDFSVFAAMHGILYTQL